MPSDLTWKRPPVAIEPDAPVFIVGAADGGAERLAALLDTHPRLSCVPRTGLLADLVGAIERNQAALVHYGMPEQYWRRAVAGFYGDLQRQHAAHERKPRWLECVSPASLSIDELDHLFPLAQFVHVLPRASRSRRRVAADRRTGGQILPGRYLEVSTEDLMSRPEECVQRVLGFLREAIDAEIVVDLDPRPNSYLRA